MTRDLVTASDRIRWAIEQSGHGLAYIAEQIGCSHAALSFWQTGKTNIANVKVGLLMEFSRVTGASLQWLLSGDGPRLVHYARVGAEAPLVASARHIVQDLDPSVAAMAYRLLSALEPTGEPKP